MFEEPTNEQRRQRARNVMDAYLTELGDARRDESDLSDLLTDLMHMAAVDKDNWPPFNKALRYARGNFEAEYTEADGDKVLADIVVLTIEGANVQSVDDGENKPLDYVNIDHDLVENGDTDSLKQFISSVEQLVEYPEWKEEAEKLLADARKKLETAFSYTAQGVKLERGAPAQA